MLPPLNLAEHRDFVTALERAYALGRQDENLDLQTRRNVELAKAIRAWDTSSHVSETLLRAVKASYRAARENTGRMVVK